MEKMKFDVKELSIMSKVLDGCGEKVTAEFIGMLKEKWRNDPDNYCFWEKMDILKSDLEEMADRRARRARNG